MLVLIVLESRFETRERVTEITPKIKYRLRSLRCTKRCSKYNVTVKQTLEKSTDLQKCKFVEINLASVQ